MDRLQKCAEILVGCGYAEMIPKESHMGFTLWMGSKEVNPFADTLEGRRQADAIEDWLRENKPVKLWKESGYHCFINEGGNYQWRLDRIKWCIQELIGEKHG